jgi:transcriptional regulator with XRE-family HTH domain
MVVTIEDMLKERPVDREVVAAHMKRMLAEISAYRLRELREKKAITQVDLASRLKVSQNRVSRIEHGDIERTQVDTLRKYVEAVGGELRIEVTIGDERFQLT